MREINLLPKKPFAQRYSLLFILCIVLIGAGVTVYLTHLKQMNDVAIGEVESEIMVLSEQIEQLESVLLAAQSEEGSHNKYDVYKQLRGNRIHWRPIIDTIFAQNNPAAAINIQNVGWSGDEALNARVQFNSLTDLVQYNERLIASELITQAMINHTSLTLIEEEVDATIETSGGDEDKELIVPSYAPKRQYNGNITIMLQSGEGQ